jgi:hypothetical protein
MNQEQFLSECGKSYPEAMVALGYFRQLVQQQCKPVVEKRLKELSEVLNVSHQSLSRPYEYAEPDRPVSTPSEYLNVGWQAKRADNLYLYFYLSWVRKPEDDSGPMGVAITIWVKDNGKREALAAELLRHCEDVAFKDEPWESKLNGREFWLTMKEDDLPQLAEKLNALAEYTIRFLKSIKGIVRVRELLTP